MSGWNMKKTTKEVLTRGDVIELVDDKVRLATREQARELEKHLKNIHERILDLERRTK